MTPRGLCRRCGEPYYDLYTYHVNVCSGKDRTKVAYGNWGAWVFKGDEHMPQWEDQTPYKELEIQAGYMQAFQRAYSPDGQPIEGLEDRIEAYASGEGPPVTNPFHAVLGERDVRLCGYKNHPCLFYQGKQVSLDPYDPDLLEHERTYGDRSWQGELHGYRFWAVQFNGNMVDLLLIEPDGTEWRSRCGYCYGAGHQRTPIMECGLNP